MQLVLNVAFVALVTLAASFLLLAKLHRQLGHMIEGRLYQEHKQKWPADVHAKYRSTPRELALHSISFALLGVSIGLLVYLDQQLIISLFAAVLTLAVFYILTLEIRKNFRREEERNKSVFENQGRRPS